MISLPSAGAQLRCAALALCVLTGLSQGSALAQPAPLQRLTPVRFASLSVPNTGFAAFVLAKEQGLFARHGLDVEFVSIDATPAGLAALASGQVQFAYAGANLVDAVVAGVPVALVYAINNAPNFDVCAIGSVRSPRDLAGKSIATINRGTSFDVVLRLWLQDQGLAEAVTVRNINTGVAAMLAAMTAGQVEAMTSTATGNTSCREQARLGYHVLVDISAAKLEFFNAGVAVNRRYMEANRGVVKSAIAAMMEGAKLFRENREVAFAHIAKIENLTDPAAIELVWTFHKARWADPPFVSEQAVAQAVRHSLNEKTRTAGPALVPTMLDNSLVSELVGK